jgi:Protein of unknown function (DUF2505)
MRVTHEVRYDASPDDVYAMLTDPVFREKAAKTQGATKVEVTVDGGSVRIDMVSPNTDIPAFARKVVGVSVHAIQEEEWDGRSADFAITTPMMPAAIRGRRELVADGDGCLDTFEGESKVRIPVIGGKLEKLFAEKLAAGWDAEHGVGVSWLEGDR